MATGVERARYPEDHWARRAATEESLQAYLQGGKNAYNQTKTEIFDRLVVGRLRGRAVLDYGGGAGYLSVRYAEQGARVTLVDAEPAALDTARLLAERSGVAERFETICAEELPPEVAARRFDVVIVKDVVEHLPDDRGFLERVARCQAPGGLLVLSTQSSWSLNYVLEGAYRRWWCGERDWCGWDPTHLRFYTPRTLDRLLSNAGYRVSHWWGMYIVPYNILSWLTLLRREIQLPVLHRIDLLAGSRFPLNRLGWNVVLAAERR